MSARRPSGWVQHGSGLIIWGLVCRRCPRGQWGLESPHGHYFTASGDTAFLQGFEDLCGDPQMCCGSKMVQVFFWLKKAKAGDPAQSGSPPDQSDSRVQGPSVLRLLRLPSWLLCSSVSAGRHSKGSLVDAAVIIIIMTITLFRWCHPIAAQLQAACVGSQCPVVTSVGWPAYQSTGMETLPWANDKGSRNGPAAPITTILPNNIISLETPVRSPNASCPPSNAEAFLLNLVLLSIVLQNGGQQGDSRPPMVLGKEAHQTTKLHHQLWKMTSLY